MLQKKQGKKDCSQKFGSKMKSFDIYGEQVKLTYKGDDTFKTTIGSVVSSCLLFLLTAWTLYRTFILFTKQNSQFNAFEYIQDLNKVGVFEPQSTGFDFAFGTGSSLDPSIGYYTVYNIDYYYTNNTDSSGNKVRLKNKTLLNITTCGNTYFNYSDQEEITKYSISNYMCVKDKDYKFQGDYYSDVFQYMEVKMWKCQNSTKK